MPRKVRLLIDECPHLIEEWDSEKNYPLVVDNINIGSQKKVWWKCNNGHISYSCSPNNRTRKNPHPSGCPICDRETRGDKVRFSKIGENNRLSVYNPKISKEWDFEKNFPITPHDVSYGSNRSVWWRCGECGHGWECPIILRLRSKCPNCVENNRKTLEKISDIFKDRGCVLLSTEYRNVCSPLLYRCSRGHEHTASFYHFNISKCDCPNGRVNRLKTKEEVEKELREMGYTLLSNTYKNGVTPISFVCEKGHVSTAKFHSLRKDRKCPLCNRTGISIMEKAWLDDICSPIPGLVYQRKIVINKKRYFVDGFDPATNTVYEFLGSYWHGDPRNIRFLSTDVHPETHKTFGQLYNETTRKLESLASAGYRVVYVWEYDYTKGVMISGVLEPMTGEV